MGTGQLSADRGRGVGIFAEIGSDKDGFLKTAACPEAPQGRFQTVDHVSTAANGRDRAVAVTTARQIKDPALLEAMAVVVAREDLILALASKSALDHPTEQHTGFQAFAGAMGGSRAVDAGLIQLIAAAMEGHRNWRQAHDRSIAGAARIFCPAVGITTAAVTVQRSAHGDADVETATIAAHVAPFLPCAVALHLIRSIQSGAVDQALSQAQSHRGVIGPFTWIERKRTTATQIRNLRERATRFEFGRRSNSIADGKTEEAPPEPINGLNWP